MILDNDEAAKRHGVKPTYKDVKGFGSLQILWNRKVVDAIFRGGNKHSNAGDTALKMVTELVDLICTAGQYHYHQLGSESRSGQGLFCSERERVDLGRGDHP